MTLANETNKTATHHIRHSDFTTQKRRIVLSKIASMANQGDFVRLNDGQLIGRCWEKLSEFICDAVTPTFSEYQHLVNTTSPSFKAVQPGQSKTSSDVVCHPRGYARRACIMKSGIIIHQILIKAFGEPAWINVHENTTYLSLEF